MLGAAGVMLMVGVAAAMVPGARAWAARAGAGVRVRGGLAGAGVNWVGGMEVQQPDSGGRFSHRLHRGVACTSCHASGSSHGALKVRTRNDCLACHHSPKQAVGCVTCHPASGLPGGLKRSVQVRTSVAATVSTRTLPFAHEYHKSLSCGSCHDSGLQHRPVKDCTSCHDRHHTAARDCMLCHKPENVKGHPGGARVHWGCGGAGCHSDRAVLSLTWSRTVCTVCHQDRVRHKPGRECATCHQVPAPHNERKEAP